MPTYASALSPHHHSLLDSYPPIPLPFTIFLTSHFLCLATVLRKVAEPDHFVPKTGSDQWGGTRSGYDLINVQINCFNIHRNSFVPQIYKFLIHTSVFWNFFRKPALKKRALIVRLVSGPGTGGENSRIRITKLFCISSPQLPFTVRHTLPPLPNPLETQICNSQLLLPGPESCMAQVVASSSQTSQYQLIARLRHAFLVLFQPTDWGKIAPPPSLLGLLVSLQLPP